MNRFVFLPLALAVAGCGTPPNEVIRLRDGVMRATTYVQASDYCQKSGSSARMLGKAPAESGVLFRCD